MPELPEVETIKRDLEARLTGRTITRCEVRDLTVLTGHRVRGKLRRSVAAEGFRRAVEGKRIEKFHRRGKYIVMEFADATALVFHLRMTGQLLLSPPQNKERAAFRLDDGSWLCFKDHRRFGEVLYSTDWRREKPLAILGIEPLNGQMSAERLKELFRNRAASIHSVLLNQQLISGVGNIYAAECLFRAGIRPTRSVRRIPAAKLELLCQSLRAVLLESIETRGHSMRSYVDALGRKGRSQLFTAVYGKDGLPCSACKSILKRKTLTGRSVVYCPTCQK